MEVFDPNAAVQLSERAVAQLQTLLSEPGNAEMKFRVYVTGGGCSGFQYGFTLDGEVAEDDACFAQQGVTVLVDSLSYQYLFGSAVDYTEDLEGSRFVVNNPNATVTCGCGASFAV